jgi:hypothetical protein
VDSGQEGRASERTDVEAEGDRAPLGSKRPAQRQLEHSPPKQAKAADDDEAHLYGEVEDHERRGGEEEEEGDDQAKAEEEARALVHAFVDWCKTEYIKSGQGRTALLTSFPREKVHRWWGAVGVKALQKKWARLGWVARALLSITAGSGNLERYFCNVPAVVTTKRSSLSPARVEMLIICHILQQMGVKLTPDQVKRLSKKQAQQALPGRMKKAGLMRRLKEMFERVDSSEEEEEELWLPDYADAMAPWSSVAEMLAGWDEVQEVEVEAPTMETE